MDASDFLRLGLLVFVVPLVSLFVATARMRFRLQRRTRITEEDVPAYQTDIVARAGQALEQLGFELISAVEIAPTEVTEADTRQVFQLYDASSRTWAYLGTYGAMREEPTHVVFESFTRGAEGLDVLLMTEAAWWAPGLLPSRRLEVAGVPRTDDVREMFRSHTAAVQGRQLLELSPDEALATAEACHADTILEGEREGRFVREGDIYRFTVMQTLRTVRWIRFSSGMPQANAENTRLSLQQAPAPSAIEAQRYTQLESVLARSMPRPHALLVFVLSAALFLAWFGLSSPDVALAIFFAVLIHELGHALAMKALGYRDARIYFVPGFGGAAVGEKRDASIHQEALVLLAGPVPGIVIGFGLVVMLRVLPQSPALEPLATLAAIFIAINALNLLPTLPLDGGRLVHRIIGGLHPLLDTAFRVLSILLLGGLAFALRDVLLGILATSIALQTPSAYAAAKTEHALRARGASTWPEHQRIEETFRSLSTRGWGPRYASVKQVMLRLAAPEAKAWERAVWALVYVGVIVMVLVAAAVVMLTAALAP